MKSLATYLMLPVFICMYIAANMGFGLHQCHTEGTSTLLLLAGESPCDYVHGAHHQCECGQDHPLEESAYMHDPDCCHTIVYILDQVQYASDYTKIDLPLEIVLPFHWVCVDLPDDQGFLSDVFLLANVAEPPDEGLPGFAPLRL